MSASTLSTQKTGATTGPSTPRCPLENAPRRHRYDIWTLALPTPSSPAILYYKFRVTDQSDEDFYSDSYTDDHDNLNQGGAGEPSDGEPFPAFQITAYDPNFQTPAWLHNANVYQIFPDRFAGDPTNDYCRPGSTAGDPRSTATDAAPPAAVEHGPSATRANRTPESVRQQFYGGTSKA